MVGFAVDGTSKYKTLYDKKEKEIEAVLKQLDVSVRDNTREQRDVRAVKEAWSDAALLCETILAGASLQVEADTGEEIALFEKNDSPGITS